MKERLRKDERTAVYSGWGQRPGSIQQQRFKLRFGGNEIYELLGKIFRLHTVGKLYFACMKWWLLIHFFLLTPFPSSRADTIYNKALKKVVIHRRRPGDASSAACIICCFCICLFLHTLLNFAALLVHVNFFFFFSKWVIPNLLTCILSLSEKSAWKLLVWYDHSSLKDYHIHVFFLTSSVRE